MYRFIIISILLTLSLQSFSQKEKGFVRSGNRQYEKKNYADAEIDYRKALEKQVNSTSANYNLGNALYRQNKYDDAITQFRNVGESRAEKLERAKAYHNLGNSFLQSQKFDESIESYKKALRLNPFDKETKYNLAVAQMMKKNPPKQDQNKNQNNNDNKDNKDNKDKQNKNDQNKDNKDKDNQNQQPQPQDGKISKDDAKRMLEAVQNDENNTQDKLKKEKADSKKKRPDVDW